MKLKWWTKTRAGKALEEAQDRATEQALEDTLLAVGILENLRNRWLDAERQLRILGTACKLLEMEMDGKMKDLAREAERRAREQEEEGR